ncbi:MAG: tRNA uridine-5-carboxymethylaminomethyl(34) synthesis GTPase MnmE [Terriglobales bacterium]
MELDDTIVAISTPPGRGGLGVVRLSGARAREIAAPLLRLKHPFEPQKAVFGELVDTSRSVTGETPVLRPDETPESAPEKIDEVVVTLFAAPHSYTTEDVIEISAHGSPVVLRYIVERCLAGGARLAEPGEFTLRAFLKGRIDLTQAEAVRDLIDAQTLFQARAAARQLGGSLSKAIAPHKQKLVELIATLEAGIDFAEDDVSVLPWETIRGRIEEIAAPLRELARSFAYGKLVREGLTLAIVGRPNVGKSSLFNRLVERERAIVTATPGTTRDLVTETVALGGIPVHLVDTAGIRAAADEAESIGVRKSMEALAEADVVLMVNDLSQPQDQEPIAGLDERRTIMVGNKCDIAIDGGGNGSVRTSAITGEGIEQLRAEILRHIHVDGGSERETAMLTNLRQQQAVQAALDALDAARKAAETSTPHEMLLLDLYAALRALDELTGATTTDDILNLIFSTFCIGK